jgi:hypothetical protein
LRSNIVSDSKTTKISNDFLGKRPNQSSSLLLTMYNYEVSKKILNE